MATIFTALGDKLHRHWRLILPPLAVIFVAIGGMGGGKVDNVWFTPIVH